MLAVMPSALSSGRAVPYDAYCSPDHVQDQPPPSHAPHQHQQPTAAGGSPTVRQPWYDMSDGAATPPDDSSSSSHRGDFVGHAAAPLPHAVTTAKRRPLGCWLAVSFCTDLLLLASLTVCAYFLRCDYELHCVMFVENTSHHRHHHHLFSELRQTQCSKDANAIKEENMDVAYVWSFAMRRVTDLLPVRQVKFSCYDSTLNYQRLPVDNATVPSLPLLGRVPHNAAHVICFCLPPTIV